MQTHLQVVSELLICLCENDIRTDFNSENDNANKILELTERQHLTLHGRYLLSRGYVLIVSALNMKLSKPFGYSDMTLHLSHTHTHSITTRFHKECTIKCVTPKSHLQMRPRWKVLGLNHEKCWMQRRRARHQFLSQENGMGMISCKD